MIIISPRDIVQKGGQGGYADESLQCLVAKEWLDMMDKRRVK